jgi:hypothetical protein
MDVSTAIILYNLTWFTSERTIQASGPLLTTLTPIELNCTTITKDIN